MKKMMMVVLMVAGVWGCGKTEPVQQATAPSQTGKPVEPPTAPKVAPPESQPTNFQLPPIVKKQEKYFPDGTPSRAIQDLDDMLGSYIDDPKTPQEKQYNENLKRAVIHGTFDMRELCRLALDKHWTEITPEQQNYFVDLMINLLENKAIFSKEQGQQKKGTKTLYKVTYEGDKFLNDAKTKAVAKSLIHIPSETLNIGLDYKLEKTDQGWKIYDVVVDDASLVDNYKFQFDKIISKDGYPTLIHRMESKLKSLQDNG